LVEIEQAYPRFLDLGIRVVAANTEGDPATELLRTNHGLSFPVAHSVPLAVARALGGWTGVRQGVEYMQPCEFVLRPDGTVAASMYSTTQLGRMDPEEVLRFVKARM
jgi:peroxiredoxin